MVGLVQPGQAVAGVGRVIETDIRNRAAILSDVSQSAPSALVHLAAISEPARARSEPSRAWDVNVEGTRHLAEAVLSYAPDCRFIFACSSEAYGSAFNTHSTPAGVEEDVPLKPMTPYAATKAVCDVMLSQMAVEGLRCFRFRAFNHTGPSQPPSFVVPAFAQQIAAIEAGEQPPVVRVGNLEAKRDFLDVRDVVAAYAMAAIGENVPESGVFNLSSGKTRTIQSILDHLVAKSRVPVTVERDPERMRTSEVPYVCGNNERLRQALGWAPTIDFEQTMDDTINYWRSTFA
ncbi:hypothetical protein HY26_16690 [Hyphomonas sp. GM-8P]|nr:hypothetical protein HY26_16690 [Hyphomonas sp. GM-8P]